MELDGINRGSAMKVRIRKARRRAIAKSCKFSSQVLRFSGVDAVDFGVEESGDMATVGGAIVNLSFRMPYFMAAPDSKPPGFAKMEVFQNFLLDSNRGVHGRHHV
jgi:hypothetical protein